MSVLLLTKSGSLSVYSGGHSVYGAEPQAFALPFGDLHFSFGQECGAQSKEFAVKATAIASTA
jgi:hypothetical protein